MPSDETNRKRTPDEPSPVDWTAQLAETLIGRLTAGGAAADATVLTLTIAALTPVIQASMTFVSSTCACYQHGLLTSAELDTAAYATVARSVNEILDTTRPTRIVETEVTREEPAPLAVS